MPCSRPFQPISCSYKASKWSLRGSLLIETKCYGIDLFRESCSPYIKAIRACLLNTSEICSTGWSPLVWYKFTADLSTTAVMLLFHLKGSFPWPCTHPPPPREDTCAHIQTAHWPLTANCRNMGQIVCISISAPPAGLIMAWIICKCSTLVCLLHSVFGLDFNDSTNHNKRLRTQKRI